MIALRRKRASMRWNQGAASVAVKGGRFRTGAAATTAASGPEAASFPGIVEEKVGVSRRRSVVTPRSPFVTSEGYEDDRVQNNTDLFR